MAKAQDCERNFYTSRIAFFRLITFICLSDMASNQKSRLRHLQTYSTLVHVYLLHIYHKYSGEKRYHFSI